MVRPEGSLVDGEGALEERARRRVVPLCVEQDGEGAQARRHVGVVRPQRDLTDGEGLAGQRLGVRVAPLLVEPLDLRMQRVRASQRLRGGLCVCGACDAGEDESEQEGVAHGGSG